MRDRQEIIQEVRKFKLQSQKHQEHYPDGTIKHADHLERQEDDSLCPSGEFVDALLEKCARELCYGNRK